MPDAEASRKRQIPTAEFRALQRLSTRFNEALNGGSQTIEPEAGTSGHCLSRERCKGRPGCGDAGLWDFSPTLIGPAVLGFAFAWPSGRFRKPPLDRLQHEHAMRRNGGCSRCTSK
jgi:hypothetical protein